MLLLRQCDCECDSMDCNCLGEETRKEEEMRRGDKENKRWSGAEGTRRGEGNIGAVDWRQGSERR